MESVKDVSIDPSGKFKYILVEVKSKSTGESKLIVRGYADCEWHTDIFDRIAPDIERSGDLKCTALGGGRILRNPQDKTIKVFGYSTGYGKADHSKTCEILRETFMDFTVSWSDDGY